MADIIVTTPKSEMANAAKEAEQGKKWAEDGKVASYFRMLNSEPKNLDGNSRLFYVEDGYVRGFCKIAEVSPGGFTCEVTGRTWPGVVAIVVRAKDWKWIKPIPMKGFQGWRYFDPPKDMKVVGGWLDPKPKV